MLVLIFEQLSLRSYLICLIYAWVLQRSYCLEPPRASSLDRNLITNQTYDIFYIYINK